MPEKFNEHQSDNDESDENSEAKERASQRPYEAARAEPKKWRDEPETSSQPVPESEEVRRYAADQQAKLATEWSLDDEEEEEKAKEAEPTAPSEKPKEETDQSHLEEELNTEDEGSVTPPIETQTEEVESEATPELPEERVEALKQIAREELEKHEPEAAEPNPATDYLEKVALEGNPPEAEQEIVMDYHLDEVRAQADQAIEGLEDLLKEAADKVGDQKLSDEELTALASEVVPEGTSPAPEAFAATPSDLPHLSSTPNINQNVTTKGYRFSASPIHTSLGSGSLPPTSPPGGSGGGGGGSFGPSGFGGDRLSLLASMAGAGNANMLRHGLSAAERARMRRQTLSVALFAGLLGYYVGKKRGRKQQEAEMRPELERKEKDNKQLRYEVEAGEQRIRSLKRLKEAQEKELYERERREKFQTAEKQPTVPKEKPVSEEIQTAPVLSEQLEPMSRFESDREKTVPEEIERPQPAPTPQESPSLSPEASAGAPELPKERLAPDLPVPPVSAESFSPRPTPDTPITSEAEVPQSIERDERITEGPPLLKPIEAIGATPLEAVPSLESAQREAQPSLSPRPEIVSTRPGLEVPLTAGTIEAHPASSRERSQPERFDTPAVAAMNLPELITVAKEMTVGSENLGQLFQEKQIDAAGLKRVVAEYARGGNPEQILAQERHIMEVRRESPEFMKQKATPGSNVGTQGAGAGLLSQAQQQTDTTHLLPAYDHETYPSNTPQHLLPAYDQETVSKRHHRTTAVASAMVGMGAGILLALLLL